MGCVGFNEREGNKVKKLKDSQHVIEPAAPYVYVLTISDQLLVTLLWNHKPLKEVF